MNVISFSLYGSQSLYIQGMKANLVLAKSIYPGWRVRIYADPVAINAFKHTMGGEPNGSYDLIERPTPKGHEAMFWRFEAFADPDVRRVIIRDADSRLNIREKAAVDEWIADDTVFHVMRDHPDHSAWPILGGMFGASAYALRDIRDMAGKWLSVSENFVTEKLADMRFLASEVWPMCLDLGMTHHSSVATPHPHAKPFPAHKGIYLGHVGQIVEVC